MINRYYTKINFTSLLLIAFFIPVSKKAVPLLILIYGLNWLLLQNYKEKIQNLKKNYLKVLFLTSIYIIYLLSLCYSSNMDSGLFDMEVKLTLLLFPVILFSSPLPVKSDFNKILIAFVSGCFVAVLYCFIMATKLFIETRELSSFVYINFSVIFHPTYFSLYLNFSIIILLQFLFDNQKKQNKIFFLLFS